jgi:hypothetical protein
MEKRWLIFENDKTKVIKWIDTGFECKKEIKSYSKLSVGKNQKIKVKIMLASWQRHELSRYFLAIYFYKGNSTPVIG